MIEKKKRIRRKIGQVFKVPLGDGTFGYGQITSHHCAFFYYRDRGEISDIKEIIKKPVLFRIGVAHYAITEGIWPILGILPVAPHLEEDKAPYTYDYDKKIYVIWKTGIDKVPATPEEIAHLECFASWEPEHVEQRLRDHFAGRPNYWVEYFRNEHNPTFIKDIEEFYKQYGYEFKLPRR